jgi:hypothetical protein
MRGSYKSAFKKPANDGLILVMMRGVRWQRQYTSLVEGAGHAG